jgi:hypothetical protein
LSDTQLAALALADFLDSGEDPAFTAHVEAVKARWCSGRAEAPQTAPAAEDAGAASATPDAAAATPGPPGAEAGSPPAEAAKGPAETRVGNARSWGGALERHLRRCAEYEVPPPEAVGVFGGYRPPFGV